MNLKKFLYIAVSAALLQACSATNQGEGAHATTALRYPPAGDVIVTVNGEAITEPLLGIFARGRGLDPANPQDRRKALDLLVDNVLMAQDAIRTGVAAKPDVQAEVALVGLQQLAGRAMASYREEVDVGERELRDYYDREAKATGRIELHLQHILFADEESAKAAAADAAKPDADFEALMGEYAAKGAKQAKDLGWGNLGQYPPELAEAAMTMKDGQIGTIPLKTDFGWHVFKRVGSRPFTPPPFEQVRDNARNYLINNALADKTKALRAEAKIVEAKPAGESDRRGAVRSFRP